jgi:YD repeat-containing protein
MKKLLYLFCASLLVMTSCSSDDNNSSDSASSIVVKKRVVVSGNETYTDTYTYSGTKIASMVGADGSKTNYTYTGDVITKIEEFDDKGVIDTTTEYTYANGKLASSLEKDSSEDYNYKTVYTYNTDGTVSFADFMMNKTTGALVDDGGTVGKYTYSAGNLVKKVYSYYGFEHTNIFEYDTKNNPLKNITGIGLLLELEDSNSANNTVKETSTNSTISTITATTYTYDANGFPIEENSVYDGKISSTIKYSY